MATVISTLLGAAIGVLSKNQMMLSMFNETIAKVAKYVFSGQLYEMLNHSGNISLEAENILILGGNILLVALVFLMA